MLSLLSRLLGGEVEVAEGLMVRMVDRLVTLSEREPCGLRGGSLVILFSPHSPLLTLQLDPNTVPTFQMTLILRPATDLRTRIVNFVRKLRGKPSKIILDNNFSAQTKKFYLENINSI